MLIKITQSVEFSRCCLFGPPEVQINWSMFDVEKVISIVVGYHRLLMMKIFRSTVYQCCDDSQWLVRQPRGPWAQR